MALSHSSRDESAFLATEEARMPESQVRKRLDNASRSQSAIGAAGKYLSAGDACKLRGANHSSPQVRLSEEGADSIGRQRDIDPIGPLK
jgi:hypothetical protein